MANVLGVVIETTKALSLLLRKLLKLPKSKMWPKLGLQRLSRRKPSRLKIKLIHRLQMLAWQKDQMREKGQSLLPPKLLSRMIIIFIVMLRGKVVRRRSCGSQTLCAKIEISKGSFSV
jgi:hypothetical protein